MNLLGASTGGKIHRRALACVALVALGLIVGCDNPPARFHLNMAEMSRRDVPPAQQQVVADVLEAMWGTPDAPFALPESGLDVKKLVRAAGPVSSDQKGTKVGLYREHCAHCHGVSGDGMGPTAAFLVPYPRDYREGIFKFKSTARASRPTTADLQTVLVDGVPGTSMPSFKLLSQEDRDSLVEYVRYLSMRGETEINLANAIFDLSEGEKLETTREVLIGEILKPVTKKWNKAAADVIKPPKPPFNFGSPASIAAGRELYLNAKTNCVKCHGPTGLGDGQTTDYDEWNKMALDFINKTKNLEANKKQTAADAQVIAQNLRIIQDNLLPPRTIMPRNLRQGVYRGGRKPYDLFYRLHAGVNGTPMPGLGATPGVTPDEIWHLIAYIQSLPYAAGALSSDRSVDFRDRL